MRRSLSICLVGLTLLAAAPAAAHDTLPLDARPPPRPAAVAVDTALLFPGDTFQDCDECPPLVVVPPRGFLMGSPLDELGREPGEGPRHLVTIGGRLAAGKYEVTFEQWHACVVEGGCRHRPFDEGWGGGMRPVLNVNWHDARQFVRWLSGKTGKRYRLPSEAEWEFIARAGTTTAYPWGSDTFRPGNANCNDSSSPWGGQRSAPVGSFRPNGAGIHDLAGNVREWVEDCRHAGYRGAPADGRPWIEAGDCRRRMMRGGSWADAPDQVRSAVREFAAATLRNDTIGFRVVRSLD